MISNLNSISISGTTYTLCNDLRDRIAEVELAIQELRAKLAANATESAENPNSKFDLEIFEAII